MNYHGDEYYGRGYHVEERPRSSNESRGRGYYGEEGPQSSDGCYGRGYHDEERPRSSDGREWKCIEVSERVAVSNGTFLAEACCERCSPLHTARGVVSMPSDVLDGP